MKGPLIGSQLYKATKTLLEGKECDIADITAVITHLTKGGLKNLVKDGHVEVIVKINPSLQKYMDKSEESMKDIDNAIENLKQGRGWEFLDRSTCVVGMDLNGYSARAIVFFSLECGLELEIPFIYGRSGLYPSAHGTGYSLNCSILNERTSGFSKYGESFNDNISRIFGSVIALCDLSFVTKEEIEKQKINTMRSENIPFDLLIRFHARNILCILIKQFGIPYDKILESSDVLLASDLKIVRALAGYLAEYRVEYSKAVDSQIIKDYFNE